jgi:hypothetical protein
MRFCECGSPVFSTDKKTGIGYCKMHTYKRTDTDKRSIIQKAISKNALKKELPKIRSLIPSNNFKKIKQVYYEPDLDLEKWYNERRKEMTGKCCECGKSTNKDNPKYFRWSICHIVPKGLCPSTAVISDNWIELCIDHHTLFDSTFEKASKMKCFELAKRKFSKFKHILPKEELRKVNPEL